MRDSQKTLHQLYPHLGKSSSVATDANILSESVLRKSEDSAHTQLSFFRNNIEMLTRMANALASTFASGGRLLCIGNGGSSCDAAHLAVEFNHPVTTGRPALPAINLCNDTAMLTAVGNDVGFEEIFARQVISLGRSGDALFGISTSGNSANLTRAFSEASKRGILTFALLGGDGGEIARSCQVDHCLTVPSDSVHRIQETHVLTYHILWDLVHTVMADKR